MQDHGSLIPVHYIHKMDVSETPCKYLLQQEIMLVPYITSHRGAT